MNLDRVIAVRNDKTVYKDGDRCVKVFNAEYDKADVLNEALNQARVEQTGLNVPKVMGVGIIDGKWAISSEYVKGKTLDYLIAENPQNKTDYLSLLVQLQKGVHQKNCPQLNPLKEKTKKKILSSGLDQKLCDNLLAKLEQVADNQGLCHGDFNPSNVIVSEEGQAYILDWSHATQGNVYLDVACTYLLLLLKNDNDGAKFYIDQYCQNDEQKQKVLDLVPIVAGAKYLKANKNAKQIITPWLVRA